MVSTKPKPEQALDDATEHADVPGTMKDRGGIQSVMRGFAILEIVARHREGIKLGDLSKIVGLHTSTTFHIVKTMVTLGYLRQIPETKAYRVGRPLFTLAASALDETEMVSLANPILQDLSTITGESAHFAVRAGDGIVVLARTVGTGAFQLMERAGAGRPAYCTALGKIILAELPIDQFDNYLRRNPLVPLTNKSIVDPDRLRVEIAGIRNQGIAYDDGEFNAEVRCIAVGVRNFTGQIVGAIGISGAIWRLSIQLLDEKACYVREAAARLSAEFGYTNTAAVAASANSAELKPILSRRKLKSA